jgi:hypothetical protein
VLTLKKQQLEPAGAAKYFMARIIPRKEPSGEVKASSEVDFALVLSRTISSVIAGPEQLRTTVYELARHKLHEQIADEAPEEIDRLADALEVAIKGVETHFNRMELRALDGPDEQPLRLGAPENQTILAPNAAIAGSTIFDAGYDAEPFSDEKRWHQPDWKPKAARKQWKFTAPWRYAAVVAVVVAIAFAIQQRVNPLAMMRSNVGQGTVASRAVLKPVQATAEQTSPAQAEAEPAQPAGLLPTTFGVYAVSDGKLYPLELLPGHAPSPRVAISAAISTPSKTVLPDPRVKFIVFKRDSATSALDRAEVRVIAKISQAMTFDKAGKPVITKAEESNWVIRNISYPYLTAPLKGQRDMYEVVGEDAEKPLASGRYALILKGESYDFTVAGDVKDSKHCLESVAAANGAFYSECQKAPAK